MIGHRCANAILCNPLLLALDSMVFSIRINGAVIHNAFIAREAFGATRVLSHNTGLRIPAARYLLINTLLFADGWLYAGRRIIVSSLYDAPVVAGISK